MGGRHGRSEVETCKVFSERHQRGGEKEVGGRVRAKRSVEKKTCPTRPCTPPLPGVGVLVHVGWLWGAVGVVRGRGRGFVGGIYHSGEGAKERAGFI